MTKFHTLALIASAAFIGIGSSAAMADPNSGDPYAQGYAAGAASQRQNNFSAYNDGVQQGQTQQDAQNQAYNNGYQAGLAQASSGSNQSTLDYSNGYNERAQQDTNQAFQDGFRQGADAQARDDEDYYPW